MKKLLLHLIAILLVGSCSSENQNQKASTQFKEEGNQIAGHNDVPLQSLNDSPMNDLIKKKAKDTKESNKNNNLKSKRFTSQDSTLYGRVRKGNFLCYSAKHDGTGPSNAYSGYPKVEVLNKEEKVIKTIEMLEYQQLFPEFDSIEFLGASHPFRLHLKDSTDAEAFAVYRDVLPPQEGKPVLLGNHEYEYKNGVLWMFTSCLAIVRDVLGAETEVIGVDSSGTEIGRQTFKGSIRYFSVSRDNQFISIFTGGLMTERAEFANPMEYYLYNVKEDKVWYTISVMSDKARLNGKINKDKAYVYTLTPNGDGIIKLDIIDLIQKKRYTIEKDFWNEYGRGGGFQTFEDHITYKKYKFYFEKDFIQSPI